jgi:enoyl-CoA hydratase/carnithine racemase
VAEDAGPLRVIEESPAYWRIVFDYPPFNIVDATLYQALQDLLARMDASPSLRVVVFESANPEFYLAHFDLTGKTGNITTAVGPSGLPILTDTFMRITRSPVASIAKIRGCVRGVSSEFVLACDMRFASRENTLLGQPEVGSPTGKELRTRMARNARLAPREIDAVGFGFSATRIPGSRWIVNMDATGSHLARTWPANYRS